MSEVSTNTSLTGSKKEFLSKGAAQILHIALDSLKYHATDKFADLILESLKDEANSFQFILTIRNIEEDKIDAHS